mgnify:CR=1 FL=1
MNTLSKKLAEAEAAKAKVDFTFATPEVKEALLAGMAASEKVLKEHDTSTQDQVNEQLNQLTALLKALGWSSQSNKRKRSSLCSDNRSDCSINKQAKSPFWRGFAGTPGEK